MAAYHCQCIFCDHFQVIFTKSLFKIFICDKCCKRFRGIHVNCAKSKFHLNMGWLEYGTTCPNYCEVSGVFRLIHIKPVRETHCPRCGIELPQQRAIQESTNVWDWDSVQQEWREKKQAQKIEYIEKGQISDSKLDAHTLLENCEIKPVGTYANKNYWNNHKRIGKIYGWTSDKDIPYIFRKKDWIELGHNVEFLQTAKPRDLYELAQRLTEMAENEWKSFSTDAHFDAVENIGKVLEERRLRKEYDSIVIQHKQQKLLKEQQQEQEELRIKQQQEQELELKKKQEQEQQEKFKQLEIDSLVFWEDYQSIPFRIDYLKKLSTEEVLNLKQNLLKHFQLARQEDFMMSLRLVEMKIKGSSFFD